MVIIHRYQRFFPDQDQAIGRLNYAALMLATICIIDLVKQKKRLPTTTETAMDSGFIDRIVKVAKKDLKQNAEVYRNLEQYDRGGLPKTEVLVRNTNLQDFVRTL